MLTLSTPGCCGEQEDIDESEDFKGELVGEELDWARSYGTDDNPERRCEMACLKYLVVGHYSIVSNCEATGAGEYADRPWDPANPSTTVRCTARYIQNAFCT